MEQHSSPPTLVYLPKLAANVTGIGGSLSHSERCTGLQRPGLYMGWRHDPDLVRLLHTGHLFRTTVSADRHADDPQDGSVRGNRFLGIPEPQGTREP